MEKKEFIKLIKQDDVFKRRESSGSIPLETLQMFLLSDFYSLERWQNWIKNTKEDSWSRNLTHISKVKNRIYISFLFAEIEPEEDIFETTEENFLEIIEQWDKLKRKGYKEIIIIREEDGRVKLSGSNTLSPKWIEKKVEYKPRWFVINVRAYGYDNIEEEEVYDDPRLAILRGNDEQLGEFLLQFFNNKLRKLLGEIWFENNAFMPMSDQVEYIYGAKCNDKISIKDIIGQLSEFSWKRKGDHDNSTAEWQQKDEEQPLLDERILSIEIYTQ